MADALSNWTKCDDGTYCTEASQIGMKPGQVPYSMSLPEGRYCVCYDWQPQRNNDGEITHWVSPKWGTLQFTIFND
jgi:hypothetical protein